MLIEIMRSTKANYDTELVNLISSPQRLSELSNITINSNFNDIKTILFSIDNKLSKLSKDEYYVSITARPSNKTSTVNIALLSLYDKFDKVVSELVSDYVIISKTRNSQKYHIPKNLGVVEVNDDFKEVRVTSIVFKVFDNLINSLYKKYDKPFVVKMRISNKAKIFELQVMDQRYITLWTDFNSNEIGSDAVINSKITDLGVNSHAASIGELFDIISQKMPGGI